MIVYNKTKEDFSNDVLTNNIKNIVAGCILDKTGKRIGKNELLSFQNSLSYMDKVLYDREIPDNCGISIEYHLPQTSKRVDFIITGQKDNSDSAIIIELKQWESAKITSKDGVVVTRFQHGEQESPHPSYQAWSYAAFLMSFNQTISEEQINLYACAYLHNYEPDTIIENEFYNYYLKKAPVFLKDGAKKLRKFIKKHINKGDSNNIIARIDNGKIKPTKTLADNLASMIKGNKEFIMLDDQKLVYETSLKLAKESNESNKNTFIVEGGPGSGKSVVSINLLVELNRRGLMSQYVTKTSAPRAVYFEKLRGEKKMVELKNLFVGSGSFMRAPENAINCLIVDEAHRLTERTGFLKKGENQIKEILQSSLFSVFFIDENQKVSVDDYGEIFEIERIAESLGINVHRDKLQSQFRCNGSDGYLAWVNNILQIKDTANYNMDDIDFDFKVYDSPKELQKAIYEKNKINNRARLVAGYCWEWESKRNPDVFDFKEEEFGFNMKWNMTDYGGKWIIDPNSVTEIGCIHTAQGLEADYIGVILGNDLIVRNGEVKVDPGSRANDDRTIFGWKSGIRNNPDYWKPLLKDIIKNTYRTLMTRGMKGCYIYSTDAETREYFKGAFK